MPRVEISFCCDRDPESQCQRASAREPVPESQCQSTRSNHAHPLLSASRPRCFAPSVASGHGVNATRHDCRCDANVLPRGGWWQSSVNREFQINGLLTILRCRSSRSLAGSYRSSFDHRKCCRYAQQMARILYPATSLLAMLLVTLSRDESSHRCQFLAWCGEH